MTRSGTLGGIVLAGGAAKRLSGADKPMLDVGGTPLLTRAVAALRDAAEIVVVGPQRPEITGVRWALEQPPRSGPVAALAAGIGALTGGADDVAVLAGDLVGVTAATVRTLRDAIGAADGAVLVDSTGQRQWLIGVWRLASLRSALPADPVGASLHSTLGGLSIAEVPGTEAETADVDTEADLGRARGD